MKIGAQLYTVRMFTQTVSDFEKTIKRVADIGYRTVQLSAIGKEVTPQIAREICDKYGMEIVLTHSDVNRILRDTENLIKDHEVMGCRSIGLGCMPEKYMNEDWIREFCADFRKPAQMIRDAGMQFMYHNHNFEFEKIGGKLMMEYLLEAFEPEEMGIILDTFWVQTAGADVCQWIERLSDRLTCVHLKDRGVVKRQDVMMPVMEGNMNFPAIMEALEKTCCEHALVEQDTCQESPFICLEKSYQNLKKLGYE